MNKFAWLSRLVAIDTTSHKSNLELINQIKAWLATHHIASNLTYDESKSKANLFATLPAHDKTIKGGIILSGHTDVVPVEGQKWQTDPFKAIEKDNKIYGRGTCDMKGFIAVVLALVPQFNKMSLKQPMHLAFSYDEEVGCRGARLLIAELPRLGIKANACIVGEPTNMRPVVGHKGIQLFHCRVQGRAAHSSLTPQGCNAIDYAARLICYIRDLAEHLRQNGPFDAHYDVPFTSISTNKINGGIANNIIPALCEFYFEFRHLAQVKPSTIIEPIESYVQNKLLLMMQRDYPEASIQVEPIAAVPAFAADEHASIYRLAQTISGVKKIFKVAYATEAGLFQAANIPTIVCGPGNIEQAHCPNEYVEIEQLNQCERFLLALAENGLDSL